MVYSCKTHFKLYWYLHWTHLSLVCKSKNLSLANTAYFRLDMIYLNFMLSYNKPCCTRFCFWSFEFLRKHTEPAHILVKNNLSYLDSIACPETVVSFGGSTYIFRCGSYTWYTEKVLFLEKRGSSGSMFVYCWRFGSPSL